MTHALQNHEAGAVRISCLLQGRGGEKREKREKRGKGGVKGLYFRGGKGGYFKAQ